MKGKHRSSRTADGGDRPLRHGPDRPRPHRPAPSQAPARSDHGIWLYGIHPVLAALANPDRRVLRIVLTPDSDAALGPRIGALGQSRGGDLPRPEILPREALERLIARGAVHQGVAAKVDALEEPHLDDIIRATEGQGSARVVVLDQVTDPHNVGAIIRSAAAFGVAGVLVLERHAPGQTGTMAKAASGAIERVPIVRVVNLARALDDLKKAGFWCVGLDAGATTAISEADLTGKVALVLGAEGEGLRRLTRERCDMMVRIPIAGATESLNVSNAAAVALYELTRPR